MTLAEANQAKRKAYGRVLHEVFEICENEPERKRLLDVVDAYAEAYEQYTDTRIDGAIAAAFAECKR